MSILVNLSKYFHKKKQTNQSPGFHRDFWTFPSAESPTESHYFFLSVFPSSNYVQLNFSENVL